MPRLNQKAMPDEVTVLVKTFRRPGTERHQMSGEEILLHQLPGYDFAVLGCFGQGCSAFARSDPMEYAPAERRAHQRAGMPWGPHVSGSAKFRFA